MAQKGESVGGRYRLLEKLGAGALGEVWAARDERTERELAIKLLRPSWNVAAKSLESFFRENKAAAKIRHASVLELLDTGETDDNGERVPFVGMELLEAEKLEELLARVDTLPVGTALRLASELAWALVAAHEKNIVHERIEPANVLLHRDVRGEIVPKLVDFGVSRLIEDLEIAPGTPHEALSPIQYLSPEQIHADVELDGRADVYGLAALLHRCIIGTPPFDGPGVDELLEQIEEGPKKLEPFEPPIDNKVIQLIADSLQRNRKLRPTMRVFAERVDALLERIDPQWKAFSKLVRIPDERTIEHIQQLRPAKVLGRVNLVKQAQVSPIISVREESAPNTPRSDPRSDDEEAPVSAIPISGSALEDAPPSLVEPKKSAPPPLPLPGLEDAPPISQIIQEKMRTTKSNALALDVLADLEKELLKHVARPSDADANVPKLDDIFKNRPSVTPESKALLDTPAPPSSRRGADAAPDSTKKDEDGEKKSDKAAKPVAATQRVVKKPEGEAKAAVPAEQPQQKSNAALILGALAAIVLVVYFVMPKGNAEESTTPAAASSSAPVPPPPVTQMAAPAPTPTPVEIPTVAATAAPTASVAPVASVVPVASAKPVVTAAPPPPPGPGPVAVKPTAAPKPTATAAPTTEPTPTAPPPPPKPADPTYGVDNAGF